MSARVDAELVRRGLARSRGRAAELIDAGRVSLDGRVVAKPSLPVRPDQEILVDPDPADQGYASRAAFKLAGALDAVRAGAPGLAPRIEGAHGLDLGASTGGFTDVLLRRGARGVVAVDVGHDQLVPSLRDDPRVTVREGFNVRDLTPDDLDVTPDVVVADLSFISLRLVLPPVAAVVGPGTDLLLMVKPQFEVGRERLGTGGVVRDPALHARAVLDVALDAEGLGLRPLGVIPSPLPGPSGNREFFLWLRPDPRVGDMARGPHQDVHRATLERAIDQAVRSPLGEQPLVALVGEPAEPDGVRPADLTDSHTAPGDQSSPRDHVGPRDQSSPRVGATDHLDRAAGTDQHRSTGGAL
ncbi:TlyA family RNA methyltransferase [Oerskovia enterophila]|uniref:16S/23S rRNA (Cytidine-2'-O)-methyltransferase TlyA n=1 Tax=Oerskovia enterophila TaxID=43678 RepID=A0A163QHI1_9CELL|nr:TlyA family RNA methyltransferase [Oerskovia enterophila]KZM34174.1 16S/23S rRNA (cytidine-2'-O)-methyltransferase TlyA [Oerskovia enterophila]